MVRAPDLPRPPAAIEGLALFLDFDGTLVDIAPTPGSVHLSADLVPLLATLARALDGRLAIVSGRGAREIADLLGNPPLIIAGSHGLETRWPDGRIDAPQPPALDDIVAAMDGFAAAHHGVLVERKPFGAALHWRRAPEQAEAAQALAASLARQHGLKLQPGKMVAELRPAGMDKGGAIAALMSHARMHGAAPWFLGDDITDEAGFRACAALGGAGVLIGEARETSATYRLPDVPTVHAWLTELAAAVPTVSSAT